MSGQPTNSQSDINKFRNEYMETLDLQDEINDYNLQANKTYLLTGALPPQTQMQDTRTNAEKLRDVELMKQNIAEQLRPIAEPSFAYAIVNKVMDSPLNIDNSLFRFLAQRTGSITEQLKKIYQYGIAGDENDVLRIVEYIKNMYSETQGKFQTTKSYMNSISSASNSKVISANDIDNVISGLNDIIKNFRILGSNISLKNLIKTLTNLKDALPTTDELKFFLSEPVDLATVGGVMTEKMNSSKLKAFFDLLEKLPKYTEVMALINKIKQYASSNNPNMVNDGISRLRKMFLSVEGIDNIRLLNEFKSIKNRQEQKISSMMKKEEPIPEEDEEDEEEEDENAGLPAAVGALGALGTAQAYMNYPKGDQDMTEEFKKTFAGLPYSGSVWTSEYFPDKTFKLLSTSKQKGNIMYTLQGDDGSEIDVPENDFKKTFKPFSDRIIQGTQRGTAPLDYGYQSQFTYQPTNISQFLNQAQQPGLLGFGINATTRRRGRPRGGSIKPEPLPKPKTFIGFGINEINQKKLNDGIVKIRRNTKTNYMDMPSKRVSNNLKGIIKTIVGGGVPKFNELNSLDEDEKEYLHKIINRSSLEDKLSVPAPSKDQQEKDIHNFEIMKGQIMSGNDSQEMVKKFKLLIRKLSKQNLLPKADVEDLLDTLSDLNY